MDDAANPEEELETIPRVECQAFEHHAQEQASLNPFIPGLFDNLIDS